VSVATGSPASLLQQVDVGERSLASYFNVAPVDLLEALDRQAEQLRGTRVLHLNATPCATRWHTSARADRAY
jgi:hypothetical protein